LTVLTLLASTLYSTIPFEFIKDPVPPVIEYLYEPGLNSPDFCSLLNVDVVK